SKLGFFAERSGRGSTNRVGYSKLTFKTSHQSVGGVTTSTWNIVCFARNLRLPSKVSLMTTQSYPRPLQTALDDTIGHSSNARSGSEIKTSTKLEEPAVGQVQLRSGKTKPLYDGASLAPDLGALEGGDQLIWVRANSVFVCGDHVVRQTGLHELFAMWDYEGKVGLRDLQLKDRWKMLELRLGSPPAKNMRTLLFRCCEMQLTGVVRPSAIPAPMGGGGDDGRVKAAQPDDAEVDLSACALPGETPKMVKAGQVLRRLALRCDGGSTTRKSIQGGGSKVIQMSSLPRIMQEWRTVCDVFGPQRTSAGREDRCIISGRSKIQIGNETFETE
ncbi:hypothetical protein ACHAWF_000972, partial [Thalassiosira exigua]